MGFTKPCQSSLSLNGLRLPIKLGCGPEERVEPQMVRFDVSVSFATLPVGCRSDSIEDTACYARIAEEVSRVSVRQEYHLIESLALQAFAAIKEILTPDQRLWLKVTKEKPPIPFMNEGASFIIQDPPFEEPTSKH